MDWNTEGPDHLLDFHNWLNIWHTNIKPTLEIEFDNSINFLDIEITETDSF